MASIEVASFDCPLPVDVAVERLSKSLLPFRTINPMIDGLVGSATAEDVSLRLSGQFTLDSGLRFLGAFAATKYGCTLHGHLARPQGIRVTLWVFFSLQAVRLLAVLASSGPQGLARVGAVLGGIGIGGALLFFHDRSEKSDRRRMKTAILEALRGGG